LVGVILQIYVWNWLCKQMKLISFKGKMFISSDNLNKLNNSFSNYVAENNNCL